MWGAFVSPLLQWKSNKFDTFWEWVCSLRYPGCNAYAPNVGCAAVQYFSILSNEGHSFLKKKIIEHETCVSFSLQMLPETFLILNKLSEMCSKPYSTQLFKWNTLYSFHWIFSKYFRKKYTNVTFLENLCSGSGVGSCGRADIMQVIVVFLILRTGW